MAIKTVYVIITQQYDDVDIVACVFESEANARAHVDRLRRVFANGKSYREGHEAKRFYTIKPVNFIRARKSKPHDPEADCYRCGLPLAKGGGRNCDCDK